MDFLIASIHSSLSCFEVALIRYVLQLLRVAGRLSTGIAGSVYVYTVQYTMALRTHTQHGSGGTPAGRSVSCQAYFTTTTTYKWKLDKTETSQVDKGDLMVCVCYITSLRVAACQISLLLSHHVYHAHTLTLTHILTHTFTLTHTHTHTHSHTHTHTYTHTLTHATLPNAGNWKQSQSRQWTPTGKCTTSTWKWCAHQVPAGPLLMWL